MMLGSRSILALGAAAALSALSFEPHPYRAERPRLGPWDDEERHIPNDHGPVIDTTRESKRARRRRIARSRS